MKDEELVAICRAFRDGIIGEAASPEGMCAAVCLPLSSYLRAVHGLDVEIVETDLSGNINSQYYEHTWMKLPDGRVLDPTFDQFCSEEPVPVYLGEKTEFHIAP